MKSLLDVLSGKRRRRNKLQERVFRAHDRYVESPLYGNPILMEFAMALAYTTATIVSNLVYDCGMPEYAAVGDSFDEEKLADVASFVGWLSTYLFLNDQRAMAAERRRLGITKELDETGAENARAFDRDITEVAITMYPIRPRIQAVIDRVRGIISGEIKAGDPLIAANDAICDAVDTCFGITPPEGLAVRSRRSPHIRAPFVVHRNSVAQGMDTLSK